jgi:hypothetical protein
MDYCDALMPGECGLVSRPIFVRRQVLSLSSAVAACRKDDRFADPWRGSSDVGSTYAYAVIRAGQLY